MEREKLLADVWGGGQDAAWELSWVSMAWH